VPPAADYQPLADFLAASRPPEVALAFADVERLLGRPLPPAARGDRRWWANDDAHAQARAWLAVERMVDGLDLAGELVRFAPAPAVLARRAAARAARDAEAARDGAAHQPPPPASGGHAAPRDASASARALLGELIARRIYPWVEAGRLRWVAARGSFTPALQRRVRQQGPALLGLLAALPAPTSPERLGQYLPGVLALAEAPPNDGARNVYVSAST